MRVSNEEVSRTPGCLLGRATSNSSQVQPRLPLGAPLPLSSRAHREYTPFYKRTHAHPFFLFLVLQFLTRLSAAFQSASSSGSSSSKSKSNSAPHTVFLTKKRLTHADAGADGLDADGDDAGMSSGSSSGPFPVLLRVTNGAEDKASRIKFSTVVPSSSSSSSGSSGALAAFEATYHAHLRALLTTPLPAGSSLSAEAGAAAEGAEAAAAAAHGTAPLRKRDKAKERKVDKLLAQRKKELDDEHRGIVPVRLIGKSESSSFPFPPIPSPRCSAALEGRAGSAETDSSHISLSPLPLPDANRARRRAPAAAACAQARRQGAQGAASRRPKRKRGCGCGGWIRDRDGGIERGEDSSRRSRRSRSGDGSGWCDKQGLELRGEWDKGRGRSGRRSRQGRAEMNSQPSSGRSVRCIERECRLLFHAGLQFSTSCSSKESAMIHSRACLLLLGRERDCPWHYLGSSFLIVLALCV